MSAEKKTITFMGWGIKLQRLETMIAMAKAAGKDELQFAVGCLDDDEVKEFIDSKVSGKKKNKEQKSKEKKNKEYKHQEYRLYAMTYAYTVPAGIMLAMPAAQMVIVDDFPPIPPTPINWP